MLLGAWRRPHQGSDTLTLPFLHPPQQSVARGPFASPCGFLVSTRPQPGGGRVKGRANHHGDTPFPPPAASTLAPGHQDKAPQGQRPAGSTTPSHPGGRSDCRKGQEPARGCSVVVGLGCGRAGPHPLALYGPGGTCGWAEGSTKYPQSHGGFLQSLLFGGLVLQAHPVPIALKVPAP